MKAQSVSGMISLGNWNRVEITIEAEGEVLPGWLDLSSAYRAAEEVLEKQREEAKREQPGA